MFVNQLSPIGSLTAYLLGSFPPTNCCDCFIYHMGFKASQGAQRGQKRIETWPDVMSLCSICTEEAEG